jgi:hypothetical protein
MCTKNELRNLPDLSAAGLPLSQGRRCGASRLRYRVPVRRVNACTPSGAQGIRIRTVRGDDSQAGTGEVKSRQVQRRLYPKPRSMNSSSVKNRCAPGQRTMPTSWPRSWPWRERRGIARPSLRQKSWGSGALHWRRRTLPPRLSCRICQERAFTQGAASKESGAS